MSMRVQLTGLVSLGCVFGVASFVGCGDDTGTGGSGGGTGGSGTSTQTVTVASVSSGMNSDTIGLGCEADGDCGSGEVCVTPADSFIFGGGPANGYCSRRCTSPDECPEGLCVGDDTEAYCLLGCEIGDTPLEFLNSPLDEEKCQGRPETPCAIVTQDGGTACRPACQADSECDGRVCDPRTGMCTATANTGLPTGDACDPDAATDPCAGICVGFGDGIGLCSTLCTFGGEDIEIECGGPANGICLFAPTANELGDAAFCSEGCLSHDDCSHPTFWCSRIGGVTTDVVPNGFCTGAADCPGGQADCTAMNRTCTQTPSGPKCIDPMFPLEAGMGGAGGGGGAGGAGGSGGAGGGGGSLGGAGGAGGN